MSTITDSDLQQLKDLITAGQLATQQQIAELDKRMEVGFANVDTKFAKLEGKIDAIESKLEGKIDTMNAELSNIKSNQKSQDTRFWSLIFLIITTSIGVIGKLAKFY
jgi:Skp family chaperone for outer membrane proteins